MADIDFDDFDQDYPVTRSAAPSRWVNVIGATCSVALVLGLVVWGYKLAVRDVNGVPVVRALNSVNTSLGFESGIIIVVVAIMLDRMLRVKSK